MSKFRERLPNIGICKITQIPKKDLFSVSLLLTICLLSGGGRQAFCIVICGLEKFTK